MGYLAADFRAATPRRAISAITRLAVGVVGPLEPKIVAPAEQDLSRRGVTQGIAEAAKVAGVFFVEVDRLDPQGVEQSQTPKAIGLLDRQGILAVGPR